MQKAIVHLNRSLAVHKDYVNGYLNLGVCYFKLKDYERAKQCWSIARMYYPNNPYVIRNFSLLATVYMSEGFKVGAKDPKKGVEFIEKAVEVDPSNPDVWYNLGGASFMAGNYDKAKESWEKTLQLKPDYAKAKEGLSECWYIMGATYANKGDRQNARQCWEKSLSLNPANKRAQEGLKALQNK